jgi:hypothetical protein
MNLREHESIETRDHRHQQHDAGDAGADADRRERRLQAPRRQAGAGLGDERAADDDELNLPAGVDITIKI